MSVQPTKKKHLKLLLLLIAIFIIIPATAIYYGVIKQQHHITAADIKLDGAYLAPPKDISDFQLTDINNKPFTLQNLKGRWTMMFFGFTNCGMVCPTTLTVLNKMYKALQRELPDKQLPQVVMVTVDPERDNVKKMRSYINAFNPHFTGATGSLTNLTGLEKNLHIVAVKIQGDTKDKDDYYYDHSAEILVVNPEGKVQAYLSYPHQPENLAREYKLILSASS